MKAPESTGSPVAQGVVSQKDDVTRVADDAGEPALVEGDMDTRVQNKQQQGKNVARSPPATAHDAEGKGPIALLSKRKNKNNNRSQGRRESREVEKKKGDRLRAVQCTDRGP